MVCEGEEVPAGFWLAVDASCCFLFFATGVTRLSVTFLESYFEVLEEAPSHCLTVCARIVELWATFAEISCFGLDV